MWKCENLLPFSPFVLFWHETNIKILLFSVELKFHIPIYSIADRYKSPERIKRGMPFSSTRQQQAEITLAKMSIFPQMSMQRFWGLFKIMPNPSGFKISTEILWNQACNTPHLCCLDFCQPGNNQEQSYLGTAFILHKTKWLILTRNVSYA